MTPTFLGLSGARRNACAALWADGAIRAVCEQERLTRVRAVGLRSGGVPEQAIDQVLALAGVSMAGVSGVAVAETEVPLREGWPALPVDHHRAHAATAFLTSGLPRAAILVCDRTPGCEVSVWTADGVRLEDIGLPWRGAGFAALYADCTDVFGFRADQSHRLEALARLGCGNRVEEIRPILQYADGSIVCAPDWKQRLADLIRSDSRGPVPGADTAAAVQRRIGELLVELCGEIAAATGAEALCLGGGLFFNTYLTTAVSRSGLFRTVFVPINPGNAGLSIGAAMVTAGSDMDGQDNAPLSPFLGPEYGPDEIKRCLDGCKLSYRLGSESEVLDTVVEALRRGKLVGWFQGRMEWGPRALGNRSILADPSCPYALDNLNVFLRKRDRLRPFGVSVRADAMEAAFCGPPASPWMEFEYGVRDERLRYVMPAGASAIRVQTVSPEHSLFWQLHQRMEQAGAIGILVNTSLNGCHEPIACSPGDAVRVFYGTGLDLLVVGRFMLRK